MSHDHPEILAFLRAIADSPDDDTPRLVLADWLDEHDEDGRAEFIRCQIELARLTGCEFLALGQPEPCINTARPWSISCRYCKMCGRERELFNSGDDADWQAFGGFAIVLAVPSNYSPADLPFVVPRRGFASKVVTDWDFWSRHGDSILASPWVPGLDECELTTWPDRGRAFTLREEPSSPVDSRAAMERSLSLRWPKSLVRKWTLPPEPRADEWRPERWAPERWPADYEGRFCARLPPML